MTVKVAILGGGPGGYVAAIRCAQLGAEVVLVEEDQLGGTCLNRGCIPSKILKTAAERFEMVGNAHEFGIELSGKTRINMKKVLARKERILQWERRGVEALLKRHKVNLVHGHGRIEGYGRLSAQGKDGKKALFSWDRLIIATGSGPADLPALPFDGQGIISSDDALSLTELPDSLMIVGGGVIGCEFASIFSAFGAQVTIVEALERLLPLSSVDGDCSKTLQREMKKRKIQVYTGHVVEGVTPSPKGFIARLVPSPFTGNPREKREPLSLKTDKLLVCIGRVPNTDDIGLETIGLSTDPKGWIQVDNKMTTAIKDVFAIGDALGPEKVMLAHVASVEGIVAAENCVGGNQKMDYTAVPNAVFTTPEVAGVGMTELQAREKGLNVRVASVLFRTNSKAHVTGEIAGQVKIVSDADNGKILGVHMIGPHVTDLIAEGTLAVQTGCTTRQLAHAIHAHPTLSEVMVETAYKLLDMEVHG